jgi:proteasome alpha subunit
MKDRSDFARAGVARGKAVLIASCAEGIVLATNNPSKALRKIGEIYDRIAFAGVGRYSEFETLRVAGIRYADLRGYAYDRTDVTARALGAAYAQTLGAAFTGEPKPLEVEIAVAEVGNVVEQDQVFRISFDGSVSQETGLVVIGGDGDQMRARIADGLPDHPTLAEVLSVAALKDDEMEVAVLRRDAERRAFTRLDAGEIAAILGKG